MRFLTILVLCWLPSGAVAQTLGELENILRAHPSLAALGYRLDGPIDRLDLIVARFLT